MGQALLTWSESFSNFRHQLDDCRYFGWTEATIDEPCSWGGMRCNDEGTTFGLTLWYTGVEGTGPILVPPVNLAVCCAAQCLDTWPDMAEAAKTVYHCATHSHEDAHEG